VNTGAYSKAIVAAIGTIISSLAPFYGGQKWFVVVSTTLAAVAVYLIPNTPKPPSA
jgi:hypothetical protein